MKFAIFGNTYQAKKSEQIEKLLSSLQKRHAEIIISQDFHDFLAKNQDLDINHVGTFSENHFDADMVLSIGGDGTFLKAASNVGAKNIPILGINTGRLGFLADVSPDEIDDTIEDIYNNNYNYRRRRYHS